MKRNVLFVFITILLISKSFDIFGKKKDPPVDFHPIELSIQQLFKEIKETKDDSFAVQKHLQIEEILEQTLVLPSAYKYKFDSLRMIGKIYAPRKQFRIFNWNHSMRDGTHRHFALIIFPGKKKMPNKVIRLTDRSDSIVKPERQVLGPDEWFGTLYYKVIPKRKAKDKRVYYTLLGLDMNDLQTKKKIIEVVTFDKNGEPRFGAPIIELNGRTRHRAIFEFAAHQSMYLEYEWFRRRIEFDHLSPLMPYLVGEYEYYEPDLYRDALKFKKGHWKYYKDVKDRPKDKKLRKRELPKQPGIKPPKPQKKTEEEKSKEEVPEGSPDSPESEQSENDSMK